MFFSRLFRSFSMTRMLCANSVASLNMASFRRLEVVRKVRFSTTMGVFW
jgi:heat shock protein HslJ